MGKKKNTGQQRLLAAARRALADRHAKSPVPAYNAKAARIDAAGKRARRAENQPTPEQEGKAVYVEADVNDYVGGRRMRIGRAFRRQPRFETVEGLTLAQLLALRRYRRVFDTSEMSPVKSALDVGPGGGSGGAEAAISRIEAIAFADRGLRHIEARIPPHLLPALRAVALHDQDFKAAAVARYGTASSRRRERVRREFLMAAELLAKPPAHEPAPAVTEAEASTALATGVVVPPAFMDDRGYMRPLPEIADIIREASAPQADELA
jgi:hypothetical protein